MRHPNSISSLLAVFFAVGCGPLITEPKPDIPETVEYETVRIEYGEGKRVDNALIGDVSFPALLTRGAVVTTNLLMVYPFLLLNEIKKFPPTESGPGYWNWEHQDEEGAFRLEIRALGTSTLRGSEDYLFKIFGGETRDELLELIDGTYTLAEGRFLGAQRGVGVLHFDFDNIRAFDKKEDEVYGQMYIGFRVLGGVKQVHVVTDGVHKKGEENETLSRALYRYSQFEKELGEFQLVSKSDFLVDGEPLETMAIHSAWDAKEGRSMSRISDGSLEINELLLEDCWENDRIVFADITPDLPQINYEDGVRTSCNERVAGVELVPPSAQAPERITEPPSRHPDEVTEVVVEP